MKTIHKNLKWDTIFNRIKANYDKDFMIDASDSIYQLINGCWMFYAKGNRDNQGFIDSILN